MKLFLFPLLTLLLVGCGDTHYIPDYVRPTVPTKYHDARRAHVAYDTVADDCYSVITLGNGGMLIHDVDTRVCEVLELKETK